MGGVEVVDVFNELFNGTLPVGIKVALQLTSPTLG